jgi:hypothetical protein
MVLLAPIPHNGTGIQDLGDIVYIRTLWPALHTS